MIRFGIIGAGWRTRFFLRIAAAAPDRFQCVGIMTRDLARAAEWLPPFTHVPVFTTIDELAALRPLFIVTSVSWDRNPGLLTDLAARGIPSLSETPPARTVEQMIELWRLVEGGAKIAVAEQYHLQPMHAARIAFARSGKIGTPNSAQVSVAHGYHGISLIRRTLGINCENATITATKFASPIVTPRTREAFPESETITSSEQVIAWLNWGDRLGVFDFASEQYWSPVRGHRVDVRGERGEIINDSALYLRDFKTHTRVDFIRQTAGETGNLEGHYLKGIIAGDSWVYENPLAPAPLPDDEIAIGMCMVKMAEYADGAPPFYSLAEACQDRYLDIAIWDAANSGQPVTTATQPWAF